jgi:hypothetical protein
MLAIYSVEDIEYHECLLEEHNKYGLNLVDNIKYCRQGFILIDKYYLYNLFLDTSIGKFGSEMPIVMEILKSIPNAHIYMRCAKTLAVSVGEQINTATMDFQKFRGINLALADIESLVSGKELVVHYNPETLNKLLLVVKKDKEVDGMICFHIEVEELWNPEKVRDDIIVVNDMHSKYIPSIGGFNHIDFSVNQYNTEVFCLKYYDAVNDNDVPIDKYADRHYKVWCVESEIIEVSIWSSLVSATLDEPFRDLFCEMFPKEMERQSL